MNIELCQFRRIERGLAWYAEITSALRPISGIGTARTHARCQPPLNTAALVASGYPNLVADSTQCQVDSEDIRLEHESVQCRKRAQAAHRPSFQRLPPVRAWPCP